MSLELEDRLERAADALPAPTGDSQDRAQSAALAVLPEAPSRNRRVVFLLPAVAVGLAVGAAIALLVGPWRDSPLATERALAALGDLPIVHAIVEHPTPRGAVIDLESGTERPVEGSRSEYWYDDERDSLRVRLSAGDELLPGGEYLHTPEGFFTDLGVRRDQPRARVDPALESFASGYREALASGEATVVGEEVVDGRDAVILRFALPANGSVVQAFQEVAVDAGDYRPLRFRFSLPFTGRRAIPWSAAPRIVEIGTIPRDPSDFQPPEAGEPRPEQQTGVDERVLTPAQAATALGRPVVWPGREVEDVELTEIELMRLKTQWTDGRTTHGHSLVFQYGPDRRTAHLEGRRSLIMTLGTSVEENPRFGPLAPRSQQGELKLTGFGNADGSDVDVWFGAMQRDGVYISFESPQRELIIAAAKSMRPLG